MPGRDRGVGHGGGGISSSPAPAARLRPAVLGLCVVTVCHHQCLDTHGVLEEHIALPSPPFLFLLSL